MPRVNILIACLLLVGASSVSALAQTSAPVPNHKHYERPENYDSPQGPDAPIAPRLQNLGVHAFRVSTKSERAQLFVNQGVNLTYAFNHAEAARAFAEAARLDPNLAMAYWGHALVLGPNINAPMAPEDEPKAFELAQKALALKSRATVRERMYIDAVAARYTGRPEDRRKGDEAYAAAMARLVAAYPDDLDAQVLYSEALMDLQPWSYWTRDGRPHEGTKQIISSLERVIARNKNHPGALHLWIHLWEATDTPERAEAEADRLVPLMPGAGHIVHMPAHIYQRVGRHADVIRVNLAAAKADEDYIAQCKAQGIYPLAYYPHNLHFIWMGATSSGQKKLALDSATKLAAQVPHAALATVPILQGFLVVPYWAMVRFEQWDAILNDPGPHHQTHFTRAAWHYARAMAYTGLNRLDEATRELTSLRALVDAPEMKKEATFSSNSGHAIMRIAPEVVAGEIAARKQDWDTAISHLERAVRYEDALVYQEPHDWHAPARENLGAVLAKAGRLDEAATVYWEDLKRNAESGWSLAGLLDVLKAQGMTDQAALVEARLRKTWRDADFRRVVQTNQN
jgi:tetratricopeptide (TPR) repeat protein